MSTPTADALERTTAALVGSERRPGQVEMAEAVTVAIRTKRHLAVQAGTGTGKTLAYLVPAILSGQRTIVATATTEVELAPESGASQDPTQRGDGSGPAASRNGPIGPCQASQRRCTVMEPGLAAPW